MSRVEKIGDCTLYLEDCAERIPLMAKSFAVVTDPPYGISYVPREKNPDKKMEFATAYDGEAIVGDDAPFDPTPLLQFKFCLLWGANYFARHLPIGRWLVWDKRGRGYYGTNTFGDCELAWCSEPGPERVYLQIWNGIVREGEPREDRVHQAQKPINLFKWCITKFAPKYGPIFDPYMGSGTTGVACVKLGRRFVGVEIDPAHFETACRRIEDAVRQPDIFVEAERQCEPEQLSLLPQKG